MSIAEEIERLEALRKNGSLTDQEFARAKEKLLGGGSAQNILKTFRRSAKDSWLGGVCGGLGEQTSIPSWCWRVMFCAAVIFLGFGVLLYILIWIFAPPPEAVG
jgi:phage shock protein PspC (stress-responsive transcriptional regulator)